MANGAGAAAAAAELENITKRQVDRSSGGAWFTFFVVYIATGDNHDNVKAKVEMTTVYISHDITVVKTIALLFEESNCQYFNLYILSIIKMLVYEC